MDDLRLPIRDFLGRDHVVCDREVHRTVLLDKGEN